MKKNVIGVIALLSVIAFSAFTSLNKTNQADLDPVLYWFDDLGYTNRHQTKALEVPDSQCPDEGTIICERGYSPDDFEEYGEPESGLKENAEPDAFIMKVTQ